MVILWEQANSGFHWLKNLFHILGALVLETQNGKVGLVVSSDGVLPKRVLALRLRHAILVGTQETHCTPTFLVPPNKSKLGHLDDLPQRLRRVIPVQALNGVRGVKANEGLEVQLALFHLVTQKRLQLRALVSWNVVPVKFRSLGVDEARCSPFRHKSLNGGRVTEIWGRQQSRIIFLVQAKVIVKFNLVVPVLKPTHPLDLVVGFATGVEVGHEI